MGDINYIELAKAKVQPKRNIVISKASKGGFTIAQQLEVDEGNRVTNIFLKGSFIADNISSLYNIRDAMNVAIKKAEEIEELEKEELISTEVKEEEEDWDS
jgi:hypothetical protein